MPPHRVPLAFLSPSPPSPFPSNSALVRRVCPSPSPQRVSAASTPRRLRATASLQPTSARIPVAPTRKTPRDALPRAAAHWEYEVDAAGHEVLREYGRASDGILAAVAEGVDDVVVVSHGWATKRDDEKGYVPFSNAMAAALLANDPRKGEEGRKVMVVGVHWPSHPATALAALRGGKISDSENYATLVERTNALRDERPADYWRTVSAELSKTDPKAAASLDKIIADAEADPSLLAALGASGSPDVAQVPESLREQLGEFAQRLAPETAEAGAKSEIDAGGGVQSGLLVKAGKELLSTTKLGGLLRPLAAVRSAIDHGAVTLRTFVDLARPMLSLLKIVPGPDVVAGGKILSRALERIFFGQFQRRAAVVGSRGVHLLLARMMDAAAGKGTRFHLVGHSLGAHVVTSAAIGRAPGSLLPHKVHTVALLQAAVPVEYYARGGPYWPLSSVLKPVAGAVVATTSKSDMALYNMELFADEVVGRQGFQDLGVESEEIALDKNSTAELGFRKGAFYSLAADAIINEMQGVAFVDLDGSHGDLLDPPLQRRLWEAMNLDGITDDDLRVKRDSELPDGYWDEEDFSVRRNA